MSGRGTIDLPIYQKAVELQQLTRGIAYCATGNGDLLRWNPRGSLREEMAGHLVGDMSLIRKQIALAAHTSSAEMRESSLQFIHVMIRNLISYCKGLEMDGMREADYLNLLRRELIGFRRSFRHWRENLSR